MDGRGELPLFLLDAPCSTRSSAGAPQSAGCLSPKLPRCPRCPRSCCLPPAWSAWAGVCPKGLHSFYTGPAHNPGSTRPRR